MPMKNSGLTWSALLRLALSLQNPSGIEPSLGASGWMYGLPKKNATPTPNSIMAIPTATSLTRGRPQIEPCIAPSTEPASPAAKTPIHGLPL